MGTPPTPSQARLAMSGPVLSTTARLFYVEIAERGGGTAIPWRVAETA
jgi:hypothetical protein